MSPSNIKINPSLKKSVEGKSLFRLGFYFHVSLKKNQDISIQADYFHLENIRFIHLFLLGKNEVK